MARFAALCALAIDFVSWFLPETRVVGLFEQQTDRHDT